jgi:hypothetical protein
LSIPDDFAALRDHDRAAAPPFDEMIARPAPARRTSPLLYVLPAAATLAMAAAFVLWIATASRSASPPADSIAAATSDPEPLGFLLDSPPALARVPDFDSSPIKERR